jgi:hypothetical protein
VDFRVAKHLGVILKFYRFEIIQILANLFVKQSKKPKQKIKMEKNKKGATAQLGRPGANSPEPAQQAPVAPPSLSSFLFIFRFLLTDGPHPLGPSLTSSTKTPRA